MFASIQVSSQHQCWRWSALVHVVYYYLCLMMFTDYIIEALFKAGQRSATFCSHKCLAHYKTSSWILQKLYKQEWQTSGFQNYNS